MGEPEPQDGRSTRPPKPADPVLSPTCPLVTGCIPTCAPLAKGEYIKFVFQGDVLFLTCVEQLLGAMRDGVRGAFCARSSSRTTSRVGRASQLWTAPGKINELFAHRPFISPAVFAEAILTFMPINIVGEPTVTLMHRDVLGAYGGFNPMCSSSSIWSCGVG